MELDAEPGVADSGSLEHDLLDLLRVAGEAARENKTALALFVDELQYLERSQFGALITAFHRIGQMQLPVALSGAGLPQIVARAGEVRSYAERLFSFADIGPLADEPAAFALEAPARPHGAIRFGCGSLSSGLPYLATAARGVRRAVFRRLRAAVRLVVNWVVLMGLLHHERTRRRSLVKLGADGRDGHLHLAHGGLHPAYGRLHLADLRDELLVVGASPTLHPVDALPKAIFYPVDALPKAIFYPVDALSKPPLDPVDALSDVGP